MASSAATMMIGSIKFNDGVADADGLKWYATIERNGPAPRSILLPRPVRHGLTWKPATYGAHSLTLRGSVTGPDYDAIKTAEVKLNQALNNVDNLGTIFRNDPLPRRIQVALSDAVLFQPEDSGVGFPGQADFSASLVAAEPFWEGLAVQSQALGASTVVVNSGNVPAWPVLTVVGAAAGPIVATCRGRTVQVNTALTAGQVLVVDFKNRTVTKQGASIYGSVTQPVQWWDLQPGSNLLSDEQGSFLTGTSIGDWTGFNATYSWDDSILPDDRTGVLMMRAIAANSMDMGLIAGKRVPVTAGNTYKFFCSFTKTTTIRNALFYTIWYTAGGAFISAPAGVIAAEPASGWLRLNQSVVAPATSALATIQIAVENCAAGEYHGIDRVGIFPGSPADWTPGNANIITYSGGGTPTLTWRPAWL